MFQNSFGLVLFYAPFVLIALFWVVVFLILRKNNFVLNPGLKKWFVFLAVLCGALHPIFFTVYQYYLWVNNAFTKILLTLPLDEKVPLFGVFQLFSFARDLAGVYLIIIKRQKIMMPSFKKKAKKFKSKWKTWSRSSVINKAN
jgi:drug/metabolite transporter (DMT)-like permease